MNIYRHFPQSSPIIVGSINTKMTIMYVVLRNVWVDVIIGDIEEETLSSIPRGFWKWGCHLLLSTGITGESERNLDLRISRTVGFPVFESRSLGLYTALSHSGQPAKSTILTRRVVGAIDKPLTSLSHCGSNWTTSQSPSRSDCRPSTSTTLTGDRTFPISKMTKSKTVDNFLSITKFF